MFPFSTLWPSMTWRLFHSDSLDGRAGLVLMSVVLSSMPLSETVRRTLLCVYVLMVSISSFNDAALFEMKKLNLSHPTVLRLYAGSS